MDHLYYSVLFLLCFSACLFISALLSPALNALTSWLLFVMSNCDFVTLPCGIHGQVWCLIVLIPDVVLFLTLTGNSPQLLN